MLSPLQEQPPVPSAASRPGLVPKVSESDKTVWTSHLSPADPVTHTLASVQLPGQPREPYSSPVAFTAFNRPRAGLVSACCSPRFSSAPGKLEADRRTCVRSNRRKECLVCFGSLST